MFTLTRFDKNPILKPNPKIWWEAQATFNGCVIKDNDRFHMLYRAFSETIVIEGKKMSLSTVGYVSSPDATQFSGNRILIQPECPWEEYGVEDPLCTLSLMPARYSQAGYRHPPLSCCNNNSSNGPSCRLWR